MSATAFHARGVTEPAPRPLDRDAARSACRVFQSADRFEVAIPEQLVERGLAFCRRARPLEWYGALVGTLHTDGRGSHALVRGLVLDPDAEATSASVRSTSASEALLRHRAALFYPDATVLGWAHGHPPGAGAFFSTTDRATQKSWTDDNALGVVFEAEDPKQLAVFRGPDSERLEPVANRGDASNATDEPRTLSTVQESLVVSQLIDEVVEKRTRETVSGAALMSWLTVVASAVFLFHYVHDHVIGAPARPDVVAVGNAPSRIVTAEGSTTTRRGLEQIVDAPLTVSAPPELACIANDGVTGDEPAASMDNAAAASRMEDHHADHRPARNRALGGRPRRGAP